MGLSADFDEAFVGGNFGCGGRRRSGGWSRHKLLGGFCGGVVFCSGIGVRWHRLGGRYWCPFCDTASAIPGLCLGAKAFIGGSVQGRTTLFTQTGGIGRSLVATTFGGRIVGTSCYR